MNLPRESIEEFISIYEAEYGRRLSFEEAKNKAESFLRLLRCVLSDDCE